MRRFLFTMLCLTVMLFAPTESKGQNIEATTRDGRAVILRPDNTWSYASEGLPTYSKPAKARVSVKSSLVRNFELYHDPAIWQKAAKKDADNAEFQLNHRDGNCSAMIFTDKAYMRFEAFRDSFLESLKSQMPDVTLTREEKRMVNKGEVSVAWIKGSPASGVVIQYVLGFTSGKTGSSQVLVYTADDLFKEFEGDIMDLVNGMSTGK